MPSKTARSTVEVKPQAIWERQARLSLSQNGLARALDVTSGHLSLILSGRRRPSAELRARMLRVLHASFDDLFYVVHPDE
ncbi:MAG: helix-turn-helix transcriptional regulator [Chloroflexi bacterium]|nr:helix-turn-helix transcriptional regulator [Chloroflexota bacterium]